MSSKSKGIRKEWALKKMLESKGYLVIRSSASKTGVDLLAGKNGKVVALQLQTSEYVYPEKIEALKKYAKAFKAEPVLCVNKKRKWIFIEPDKLEKIGKMLKVQTKNFINKQRDKFL